MANQAEDLASEIFDLEYRSLAGHFGQSLANKAHAESLNELAMQSLDRRAEQAMALGESLQLESATDVTDAGIRAADILRGIGGEHSNPTIERAAEALARSTRLNLCRE
ncbi:MAG TPA: hypothetical protein PKW35_04235 [Nannocystaceae bacterium]|nr:hypothetical protein [Nannocystaceae bacterium]